MRSGFFNSIDGDRKYDADDISNYFLKLISNGVFATPANSMQIQATTGMKVKVTPGWALRVCDSGKQYADSGNNGHEGQSYSRLGFYKLQMVSS